MLTPRDVERQSQAFFSDKATAYATSASHGAATDLARMLDVVRPAGDARVLDVATGGGHTALAFAPRVRHVVAADATPAMAQEAVRGARARGLANVSGVVAVADAVPAADAAFDVVASRIAPHHFPGLAAFLAESARLLAAGGRFYVFDLTTPEDAAAAAVIDGIERARDPSHVASRPPSAWRAAFDEATWTDVRVTTSTSTFPLVPWLDRAGLTGDARQAVMGRFAAHPPATLGGYGPDGAGGMTVLRVEVVATRR